MIDCQRIFLSVFCLFFYFVILMLMTMMKYSIENGIDDEQRSHEEISKPFYVTID